MPAHEKGPSPTPDPPRHVGTLIQNEYRIDSIVDEEDLGVLYKAHNTRRRRDFSLLLLHPKLDLSLKARAALHQDLLRARQLPASDFIPIEEVADPSGVPGFVAEIFAGESLRMRLLHGKLSVERALSLLVSVSQGLEVAHRHGLIHGALRPENIFFVDPSVKERTAGRALLLRHALYRLRPPPDVDSPLDRLVYTAPELIAREVDSPTREGDIFAIGAVLYETLTGQPAFWGATSEQVLEKLADPPPLLVPSAESGLSAALTEALNVVIAGACARDPQARIPSMQALVEALVQVAKSAGFAWASSIQPVRRNSMIQRLSGRLFQREPNQRDRHAATPLIASPSAAPDPQPDSPAMAPTERALTNSVTGLSFEWKALIERMATVPAPMPVLAAAPPSPTSNISETTTQPQVPGSPRLRPRGDGKDDKTVRIPAPQTTIKLVRPQDAAQMVLRVMNHEMDAATAIRAVQQGQAVSPLRAFAERYKKPLFTLALCAVIGLLVAFLRAGCQ